MPTFTKNSAATIAMMIGLGMDSEPQRMIPIIHGADDKHSNPQLPSKGKRSRKRRAAKLRAQLAKESSS